MHREAVTAYDRGISDYPNSKRIPDMYFKRGMALNALGQTDRARESWEYVLKNFPNSDAGRLARQRLDQMIRREPQGETETTTLKRVAAGLRARLSRGSGDPRYATTKGCFDGNREPGDPGRQPRQGRRASLHRRWRGRAEVQRGHDRVVQGPGRRAQGRDRVAPRQLLGEERGDARAVPPQGQAGVRRRPAENGEVEGQGRERPDHRRGQGGQGHPSGRRAASRRRPRGNATSLRPPRPACRCRPTTRCRSKNRRQETGDRRQKSGSDSAS